jgi:hypothetical protein
MIRVAAAGERGRGAGNGGEFDEGTAIHQRVPRNAKCKMQDAN